MDLSGRLSALSVFVETEVVDHGASNDCSHEPWLLCAIGEDGVGGGGLGTSDEPGRLGVVAPISVSEVFSSASSSQESAG